MEKLNITELVKNIEALLKGLTLASKIAILAGGMCICAYSLEIGHFPQGLTIGDGLLFMLTAACFGIIYVFFIGSLVSLGVVISPVIKGCLKLYMLTYKLRNERAPTQVYDFAKFQWLHLIFSVFSLQIIFWLGKNDSHAYWNLPLLSVALYFFYSTYLSSGEKVRKLKSSLQSVVQVGDKDSSVKNKIENLWKVQVVSLALILIIPMFVSGVTGQLLNGAMRKAHVRIENATILVKGPYASLLPSATQAAVQPLPNQYIKFENISILFTGLGNTTVLAFKDGGTEKRLELPNDQLIVE